jgi:hypothetical protein
MVSGALTFAFLPFERGVTCDGFAEAGSDDSEGRGHVVANLVEAIGFELVLGCPED